MSSLKIRTKPEDNHIQVRVLIDHPMETGRRRDESTNQLVPAHFITELVATHNGKVILRGDLTTGVSRSPYLSFRLDNARAGDRIGVFWKDNLGQRDSDEITIEST